MFANVFQRTLELVNVKENGALGTSMAAGVMAGVFPDFHAAAENMVNISKVIKPDPTMAGVYKQKYELYKKSVISQADVWANIENTVLLKPKAKELVCN